MDIPPSKKPAATNNAPPAIATIKGCELAQWQTFVVALLKASEKHAMWAAIMVVAIYGGSSFLSKILSRWFP